MGDLLLAINGTETATLSSCALQTLLAAQITSFQVKKKQAPSLLQASLGKNGFYTIGK